MTDTEFKLIQQQLDRILDTAEETKLQVNDIREHVVDLEIWQGQIDGRLKQGDDKMKDQDEVLESVITKRDLWFMAIGVSIATGGLTATIMHFITSSVGH